MKKNILIIDDSALMRRVLSDIINSDERFLVREVAVNGLEALNIMQQRGSEFDAVLLDINMPKMNGLEFLAELNAQNIRATVIIVSTIAKKDARETIKALELGAFDFITKPESFIEVKNNLFSDRIFECLAAATEINTDIRYDISLEKQERGRPDRKALLKKQKQEPPLNASKIVALACSTGGPKALHAVILKLPANLDASILIVQHMPGGFTKSLADRLNELSAISVREAEDGEILKKGTVYIAKGGYQMRVKKQGNGSCCLSVSQEPARHGLLPCADIMYESLADTDFDLITCVVLTGMGGDGTAGIIKLSEKKNIYVIAQNEETCVVYGMPKVIKDAGFVDEVAALSEVSDAIIKNVGVR
jgi:two-component system chemotaxis response regulator CheB